MPCPLLIYCERALIANDIKDWCELGVVRYVQPKDQRRTYHTPPVDHWTQRQLGQTRDMCVANGGASQYSRAEVSPVPLHAPYTHGT
jgi:hypothetical protein